MANFYSGVSPPSPASYAPTPLSFSQFGEPPYRTLRTMAKIIEPMSRTMRPSAIFIILTSARPFQFLGRLSADIPFFGNQP